MRQDAGVRGQAQFRAGLEDQCGGRVPESLGSGGHQGASKHPGVTGVGVGPGQGKHARPNLCQPQSSGRNAAAIGEISRRRVDPHQRTGSQCHAPQCPRIQAVHVRGPEVRGIPGFYPERHASTGSRRDRTVRRFGGNGRKRHCPTDRHRGGPGVGIRASQNQRPARGSQRDSRTTVDLRHIPQHTAAASNQDRVGCGPDVFARHLKNAPVEGNQGRACPGAGDVYGSGHSAACDLQLASGCRGKNHGPGARIAKCNRTAQQGGAAANTDPVGGQTRAGLDTEVHVEDVQSSLVKEEQVGVGRGFLAGRGRQRTNREIRRMSGHINRV